MPAQISTAAALRRLISPRVVEAATNLRTGEFDRLSSDVLVVGDAIRAVDELLRSADVEGLESSAGMPAAAALSRCLTPEIFQAAERVVLDTTATGAIQTIARHLLFFKGRRDSGDVEGLEPSAASPNVSPESPLAAAAVRRFLTPDVCNAAANLQRDFFDNEPLKETEAYYAARAVCELHALLSRGEPAAAARCVCPETNGHVKSRGVEPWLLPPASTTFDVKPVTLFSAADTGELEPVAEVLIAAADPPAVAIVWQSRIFVRHPGGLNFEEVPARAALSLDTLERIDVQR